ncbi:GTP cyclohydrolase II [Vibrio gallaecicus]|uniref:GTP cyclohydrolase-2 n=2 Tax=Vibrio gallaecicus TaxID=552386 RepID=A0ABV4NB23_9VIBR|nr:GTP cyclohydrolase II [Vibrio gallaecicus]
MSSDVLFYEPEDSNGYLSNFASSPIEVNDQVWATSEHYYQAMKFASSELRQKIYYAASPEDAFILSRQYEDQVRNEWDEIKVDVMRFIVTEKFKQNRYFSHLLASTGDSVIKEHSHIDSFWGDGGDGSGQNKLGHILMDIRQNLQETEPFNHVNFVDKAKLPTQWGTFQMYGFVERATGKEHLALVYGDLSEQASPLIRLHSECLTGDALFSARCDCGFQLSRAMENIVEAGSGVLFYLRQEGRGIGLINKIRAYHLQDDGADTVEANERLGFEADMRDYSFCRGMLSFLDINSVRLMTNNPRKVKAMEKSGINVVERVALQEGNNPHNNHYLKTKAEKLGHMFDESFVR